MDTFKSLGSGAKKGFNKLIGQEEEPDPEEGGILSSIKEEQEKCCNYIKLSYKQRMYGFGICFALGLVMSIIGIVMIATHHLIAFAMCYSIGTILSLMSTCFLFGPVHQIKNMFKTTRIVCTLVMLAAIAMTIVSAVVFKKAGLCVLFALIQFCAVFWYSISYIPFARSV